MILIVADTGPINYLIQIGCVNILPSLVGKVILPSAVLSELQSDKAPSEVRAWAEMIPDWVEVRKPILQIAPEIELSVADRAAISLAAEMQALLLMDDRRARRSATLHHVQTIGTVGILEVAAAKNLISLPEALRKLRQTNIFLSDEIFQQALERDKLRH